MVQGPIMLYCTDEILITAVDYISVAAGASKLERDGRALSPYSVSAFCLLLYACILQVLLSEAQLVILQYKRLA